jgi:hypothetical protein
MGAASPDCCAHTPDNGPALGGEHTTQPSGGVSDGAPAGMSARGTFERWNR